MRRGASCREGASATERSRFLAHDKSVPGGCKRSEPPGPRCSGSVEQVGGTVLVGVAEGADVAVLGDLGVGMVEDVGDVEEVEEVSSVGAAGLVHHASGGALEVVGREVV